MPEVSININGREHNITCAPGEEERVEYLASVISNAVSDLVKRLGPIGDIKLMLLASITVLDENQELIDEATEKIKKSSNELQKIIEKIKDDKIE